MVVKTFRGLLADSAPGNQDRIRLKTIKGKVGYRIVKLLITAARPGIAEGEFVVSIWKREQSTVVGTVDFTDSDLLATSYLAMSTNPATSGTIGPVIFDNEIFNQDIYVTAFDVDSSGDCNYYLELEVIPLDDMSAEYTTVKDLRTQGL